MERDLVQVYFSNTEIWLVGSRTWNGPYRASGAPAVLAASVPSRQLGEAVLTQFFLLKKYTAADENPQFYKYRKKTYLMEAVCRVLPSDRCLENGNGILIGAV